jgi:hypothetical protein
VRFLAAPAVLIALFAFVACGDDEGLTDSTMNVVVGEFFITTDSDTVPPGDVTFDLDNEGPDLEHELVILKTDFDADDIPTEEDGRVDEGAAGVDVKGRVHKFDTGRSSGVFTLKDPGKYVLICNRREKIDDVETAHYGEGMRAAFTVEDGATTE